MTVATEVRPGKDNLSLGSFGMVNVRRDENRCGVITASEVLQDMVDQFVCVQIALLTFHSNHRFHLVLSRSTPVSALGPEGTNPGCCVLCLCLSCQLK